MKDMNQANNVCNTTSSPSRRLALLLNRRSERRVPFKNMDSQSSLQGVHITVLNSDYGIEQ